MPAYIHDIVTAVPETSANQQEVREVMKERLGDDRRLQAIIHRIYSQSGIEKRHTVMSDYHEKTGNTFFDRAVSKTGSPTTAERNELYKTESTKLFLRVGQQLLDRNPEFSKEDITHVITISCTGFFAPGPDFEVVRGLGLHPSTQRYHIGFMGCYASFQGLKMAKAFCESEPKAVVMVISTELCTLHFQSKNDPDNLIASSVFSDGSAGVLVSSKPPVKSGYRLDKFASSLAYEGEQDMAWTIGDNGFNMTLSSYVPDIIEANLEDVIAPLFKNLSVSKEDVDLWAVHPGGRAIVDKVEQSMKLQEHQVKPSRSTLANYGNMSSTTILFVLKEALDTCSKNNATVLPIAFGPGLTIETGLFTLLRNR